MDIKIGVVYSFQRIGCQEEFPVQLLVIGVEDQASLCGNWNATEDVDQRYHFAVSRLKRIRNRALPVSMPGFVTRMLRGNELYQYYVGSGKKKRRLLGTGRKASRHSYS